MEFDGDEDQNEIQRRGPYFEDDIFIGEKTLRLKRSGVAGSGGARISKTGGTKYII